MSDDHRSPDAVASPSVGIGSSEVSTGGDVSSTGAGVKSRPDSIDVISCWNGCLAAILGIEAGKVDMLGVDDVGNPSESVKAGKAAVVVAFEVGEFCHISKTIGASAEDFAAGRDDTGGLGAEATVFAR